MAPQPYFVADEPALAKRLDDFLAALADRLQASPAAGEVLALVLSGGYGRGEGGVFSGAAGDAQLYNDLEFYMLLKDGAHESKAAVWCEREEREGTAELGIDVEFKRLAIGALRHAAPSMFYYDLVRGHRLIWGDGSWRQGLPDTLADAALIPLHEATRLMFNRGSGLFYSRCALAKNDERVTSGFVERNHAKARLALGDAVLAANGQYHHFSQERQVRIAAGLPDTPPGWARLIAWHKAGVEFKMRPRHTDRTMAELGEIQAELAQAWLDTFLWLESKRLGTSFSTANDYASYRGRLFPDTSALRNIALRVRDQRSRGGRLPRWTDYPRAALQRVLVKLIDPAGEPDATSVAQGLGVAVPAGEWMALESGFAHWWAHYN